ncbi:MAG TPA: cytochrome P450 [Solirubrobacteraceae bacterium]|nr:cytochrome P450 [Solirubrobacteraceae bacterium]
MTSLREPPPSAAPAPASRAPGAGTPPPGPPLPRWLQTLGFVAGGARFLEAIRRRYGDVVTLGTTFDERFVLVFSPELVRQVFQGSPTALHAGEANALLGPIVGKRSVLLLDEDAHLRHRRLMLPPFHGRAMLAWVQTMRDAADAEIDAWPVGEPFAIHPSMQALTLRVIVRAVFGFHAGSEQEARLTAALREMIAPLASRRGLMIAASLIRGRGRSRATQQFRRAREVVDELLLTEIAHRRADPGLAGRDDVFSGLLCARDEHGVGLTDDEVRDELLTLLLAGHETTATGLAWTIDLLLHEPRVLARARERDDAYLDAIVKEALRIRPVVQGVGRTVRERPFALGGYEVPVGVEINPSIRTIHRRADLFPQPQRFLPERFMSENPPDTYTWIPFGGGTRRCLGASFATTEMRTVLSAVLERCDLHAVDRTHARPQMRTITVGPKGGVRVRQTRPPLPTAS